MSRSSKSKLFKHKSNTKIGVLVLSSSPTIVKERLFPKKLKHSRLHCSFDITVPSGVIPENWNNSWNHFWIFNHTSTAERSILQYEMGIQWHLKFPNHKFLRFNTIVILSYFEWSEIFKRGCEHHLIVLCRSVSLFGGYKDRLTDWLWAEDFREFGGKRHVYKLY